MWHKYFLYENGKLFHKERGREEFMSDRSFKVWNKRYAGKSAGCKSPQGYVIVTVNSKSFKAHRVIWEMHNGTIPEGYEIDHKDQIKNNNLIVNLRLATRSQNVSNSSPRKASSLPKGVSPDGKRFKATIRIEGNLKYLGTFNTPAEAQIAYIRKGREIYNEFFYLGA